MRIDFDISFKKTLLVLFILSWLVAFGFALKAGYTEYNRTQMIKYNQAKALYDQCKLMPGALIKENRSIPVFGKGIDVTCEYYSNFPFLKRQK